tara:strand:+ start:1520 stop:2218 length:699 start_codon:yes stop_codon:yes gene_type:complete
MDKTLVVIPTYNESKNIEKLLNELNKINLDILVVDDNSPDQTSKLIKNNSNFNNSIFIIERPKKMGLGSAYREGFNWAIKNKYEFIAQMDADFSHRIVDLSKLLSFKEDFGLVLGSRYVEGGRTDGWNIRRKLLSKYANILTNYVTSSNIGDMTSGFRVYNREALEKVDFSTTETDGYSFQIEMLVRALDNKIKIKEVPITFEDREDGKSKLDSKIIIEAIITIIKLWFRKN